MINFQIYKTHIKPIKPKKPTLIKPVKPAGLGFMIKPVFYANPVYIAQLICVFLEFPLLGLTHLHKTDKSSCMVVTTCCSKHVCFNEHTAREEIHAV